jgi:predicted PurR-regulated permease PerM
MQALHSRQTRAGLLIILLGIAIIVALSPFAIGLFGAGVLFALFQPVHRRLLPTMRSHGAALLTLVLAVVLVLAPLVWLVALLVGEAPDILSSAQAMQMPSRLTEFTIGRIRVGAELAKASGTLVTWLSGQAVVFVGSVATAVLNLVISFFGLYYMLTSGEKSWETVREYVPFSNDVCDELRDRFFSVTKATLLGTALTAVLQGGIIGVGFLLVGLPNPVFWGVITGIASVLPVLGSALVWVPGVIVLLLQQRYEAAAVLGAIGAIIASNIDNAIRPFIYKRVSNIHPLITLIGAFAGVKFFGLLGVLVGPLAIAYFFELLRLYRLEFGTPEHPVEPPPESPGAEDVGPVRVV